MGLVRSLQHWVRGTGAPLHAPDFVPHSDPIRQWADTFPWTALVDAIEQRFNNRFPTTSQRGRRPVPMRVLVALELLTHALGASDEAIGHRLRTDFAVRYACGLRESPIHPAQAHCVLPTTLCAFRDRIDEALMDALIALQTAGAMDEGLVSPAHLVIDTCPCEQGSQRGTDATTLEKAQKKRERPSSTSCRGAVGGPPHCHATWTSWAKRSHASCAALAAVVAAKAKFLSPECAKPNNTSLHWGTRSTPGATRPKNALRRRPLSVSRSVHGSPRSAQWRCVTTATSASSPHSSPQARNCGIGSS